MLCVRAVRPIEAGEEITFAYVDPTRPYHERQQDLQESFLFSCLCPQCRPVPQPLRSRCPDLLLFLANWADDDAESETTL